MCRRPIHINNQEIHKHKALQENQRSTKIPILKDHKGNLLPVSHWINNGI